MFPCCLHSRERQRALARRGGNLNKSCSGLAMRGASPSANRSLVPGQWNRCATTFVRLFPARCGVKVLE
jgi:hypothetical protein